MRISDWSSDVCSSDLLLGSHLKEWITLCNQLLRFKRSLTSPATPATPATPPPPLTPCRCGADYAPDQQSCPSGYAAPWYLPRPAWPDYNRQLFNLPIGGQTTDRKSTRLNPSHNCASHMPYS